MSEYKTDRMPPHSEEAEKGLLGSVLRDPVTVLTMSRNEQKLNETSFFVPVHRVLWTVLCAMFDEAEKIDLLTVGEKLNDLGQLDAIGGREYLEQLYDSSITIAYSADYAGIVRSKWILRDAAWMARKIQDEAYGAEDAEQFLATIPERFLSIAEGISNEPERIDAYNTVIAEVTAAKERQMAIRDGRPAGPPPYVATGFEDLDKSMGGGMRNVLYMLGGEQSAGKTTLVSQIMKHVARNCRRNEKVLCFSLDASAEEHAARDMTTASKVSLPKITAGFAKKDQMKRFADSAADLATLPIVIDEECKTLPMQKSKARLLSMKGQVKLIVVDYIQRVRIGDHRVDQDRNYALSCIAGDYKDLGHELGCPVIALSQFNNAGKGDLSRFAMMGDMRSCGEMAEIAHGIWLLSKDRNLINAKGTVTHTGAPEENGIRPVWLDNAKNKNGPIGKAAMWLYAKYFFFVEAEEGAFKAAAKNAEHGRPVHRPSDYEDENEDSPEEEKQEEIIL